jgi:hypothetical protein
MAASIEDAENGKHQCVTKPAFHPAVRMASLKDKAFIAVIRRPSDHELQWKYYLWEAKLVEYSPLKMGTMDFEEIDCSFAARRCSVA